ncbi:hypothetical protein [Chloroflexus aggregans]|uniref:hypothetical protein n=1 Tax=Chloroflexus aggregans TaxID=152260 RepID=UPI00059C36D6|nr:hypothetical protein [Chloroflexus aggregans]
MAAAYDTGGRLIHRALDDARTELGRQECSITPIDFATDEMYAIPRKRLVAKLPNEHEVRFIADAFGTHLAELAKAKTVRLEDQAIADPIPLTYPFHPRQKCLVTLFKENEGYTPPPPASPPRGGKGGWTE